MTRLLGALPNTLDSMFPSPKDHGIIGHFRPGRTVWPRNGYAIRQTCSWPVFHNLLVSSTINDLDPLFTILAVEGPNRAEQSCLCVRLCLFAFEGQTGRKSSWLRVTAQQDKSATVSLQLPSQRHAVKLIWDSDGSENRWNSLFVRFVCFVFDWAFAMLSNKGRQKTWRRLVCPIAQDALEHKPSANSV